MFASSRFGLAPLLAVLVSLLPGTPRLLAEETRESMPRWTFDLEGHVLDTERSLTYYKYDGSGQRERLPQLYWSGLTIEFEKLTPTTPPDGQSDEVRRMGEDLEQSLMASRRKCAVDINMRDEDAPAKVLAAHRKTGGFGVHGPLEVKGELQVHYVWTPLGYQFAYYLGIQELHGPRGDYVTPFP